MAQPRSRSNPGPLVGLAVAAWLACAGASPAPDDGPTREPREGQRGLLGATTPQAAASTRDDDGADPPDVVPSAASGASDDAGSSGRPGRLLVYSAITGHVPLEERDAYDPAERYRSPAEREAARARSIEAEIEEELSKQEALAVEETASARSSASPATPPETAGAPLDAPPAPELRQVPESLFETQEMIVPAGAWQNRSELRVMRRSLDVDEDGRPEEIRFVDSGSGLLVRAERDRDYDGTLDAWISYESGEPALQVLDDDGDGEPDAWERYQDGRMNARTVDRDADGVRDSFLRYENGALAERLEDANNDGAIDKLEVYEQGHRVRSEEDRSLDGSMDTWTHYQVVGGREVVARVQRDTRDLGKPDVFETYETSGGVTRLQRKEEDVDGDGSIDIVSTYENGKLVQRAISDEALSPL